MNFKTPKYVTDVRTRMKQFGWELGPYYLSPTRPGYWFMVSERQGYFPGEPFAVTLYHEETKMLEHTFSSFIKARDDFERRAERESGE